MAATTVFIDGRLDGPYPEDRWYAWLDGEWVRVPPDRIVPDYAPDGRAYVFVMYGVIQFSASCVRRAACKRTRDRGADVDV